MPDYQFRSEVLASGLVHEYKQIQFLKFKTFSSDDDSLLHSLSDQELFYTWFVPEAYNEARRIAKSDYKRNNTLKNRIKHFMNMGNCIFLTLTFRDDVLQNTKPKSRRAYVTRFLKSCSQHYVANIDFGGQTNREHYHGIVVTDYVDLSQWKYGFSYAEKIIQSSNPLVLAKYVSKLANHAVKETCKRNALIYSRVPFNSSTASLDKVDFLRIDLQIFEFLSQN